MRQMHTVRAAAGIAAALMIATSGPAAGEDATPIPLDTATTIAGVGVGCTGIGQTKDDPKWLAYPVRVELADAQHNYLTGEVMTLTAPSGKALLTVSCEGPWLLLKLPDAGSYKVDVRLTEEETAAPRSAVVKSPTHGQTRFVITFPDAH
jgi:hypothetical protein